ncbi:MAG TPA: hypothetical protein VF812_06300 [Ktedonobacterales bacterium]
MATDQDLVTSDSLLRIEINPSLPCGISACGRPAHCARIERDLHYGSLWRLLPICDMHLQSLDAAARAAAAASLTQPDRLDGDPLLVE